MMEPGGLQSPCSGAWPLAEKPGKTELNDQLPRSVHHGTVFLVGVSASMSWQGTGMASHGRSTAFQELAQVPARACTWRRPNELGHRVALHVLAHVQAQQSIWAAKELVRQHLQGHTVCLFEMHCSNSLWGDPACTTLNAKRLVGKAFLGVCCASTRQGHSIQRMAEKVCASLCAVVAAAVWPLSRFHIAHHVSSPAAGLTLVSSVLPTPVGPENSKEAMGRLGSLRPPCARRRALETADTASGWPTTRLCSRHPAHCLSCMLHLRGPEVGLYAAYSAAAEASSPACSRTAQPAVAIRLPAWPRHPHFTI